MFNLPLDDPDVKTVKSAGLLTTTPCSSRPGPDAVQFEASVIFFLSGAPGLHFASGKYETYVMTESSSTFGLVISSGVITYFDRELKMKIFKSIVERSYNNEMLHSKIVEKT